MQQFADQGQQPLSDSHHDILSVGGKKQQNSLLSHINNHRYDPLAALLAEETLPAESLLTNVVVEPAEEVAAAPKFEILGQEARLSECLLWQMQADYYANAGISAWESSVPCYITNSAAIAETYAELIVSFLQDYYAHLDLSEPVYVLELATGTGRFSFLVLKQLERKLRHFSALREVKLKYVMTDFTDSNPKFWESHEGFQPYIEKGMLDFAVFAPDQDDHFELRVAKETLSAGQVKNPVIAIANYFFDTIRQDVFRVESKKIFEGLVTLERNLEGVEPGAKPQVGEVTPCFRYRELRSEHYYPDPKLNAVLGYYRHHVKNGTIIFPLGAFEVIRNLQKLSNNKLVLLSSDKSYTEWDHMIAFYEHQYAVHGGAFSYMVNYDAIGRYFTNETGGHYFSMKNHNVSLQTVCFVQLGEAAEVQPERLYYCFEEKINRLHPITSTCTLLPAENLAEGKQIDRLLAEIRTHHCDPKIICVNGQRLVELLPHATFGQLDDLRELMAIAWESFYYHPGELNLPFWLAQLHFALKDYDQSLACLDKTTACYGEHEALYFMKAQNMERLERLPEAVAFYEQALVLKPDFQEAIDALAQLKARM